MKKRTLFARQILDDRAGLGQNGGFDLSFAGAANRAQEVGLALVLGGILVHQEKETARDPQRLDDEPDGHAGQALHFEDVADRLAVFAQRAAGVELLQVQPAIHPAAHQAEQGRETGWPAQAQSPRRPPGD